MATGAITQYVDVAQVTLYAFWVFFAGLIYYLHQEDKREGYPLESDRSGSIKVQGWPPIPSPKTYLLADGSTVSLPRDRHSPQPLNARPVAPHLGAALEPTGPNLLLSGVGPGSWADRADVPDVTWDGSLRIIPLRSAPDHGVADCDADPRGLPVVGADGVEGGRVTDLWFDRSDVMFRYLEVTVAGGRHVLVPITFTRIGANAVRVRSVLGSQLADVPQLRAADRVTRLEEDKIVAYFGAGTLYATPDRQEPLL